MIDFRAAIDKWFHENLRSGAVARHTDCYNQVFAAVEKLKDAFDPPPKPEPEQPPAPSTGDPPPEQPTTISAKE